MKITGKQKNMIGAVTACTLLLCFTVVLTGTAFAENTTTAAGHMGTFWSEKYYAKHPTPRNEIIRQWGTPTAIENLGNGTEELIYHIDNTLGIGDQFFTIVNNRVVSSGICTGASKAHEPATKGFTGTFWSKEFYTNHHRTKEEILQKWGTPARIVKLENGNEELYYPIDNTMAIGNQVFLVAQNTVVASGIADRVPERSPLEANGLNGTFWSTRYYAEHAVSEHDIIQRWGNPTTVRKLADGREELFYHIDNTMDIGDGVFLIDKGKVVASGICDETWETPATAAKDGDAPAWTNYSCSGQTTTKQ